MSELTAVRKLNTRIKRIKRRLKAIYQEACRSGSDKPEVNFFADNYHTVFDGCEFLLSFDSAVRLDADFRAAKEVIRNSHNGRLCSTEQIILLLRDIASAKAIYPSDAEYLRYAVVYVLITYIDSELSKPKGNMPELISLLADIGSLDEESINDVVNPVSCALAANSTYQRSNRESRRLIRTRIYELAEQSGKDPYKLACELSGQSKSEDTELSELLGFTGGVKLSKSVWYAISVFLISLAVTVFFSAWLYAPWAGPFLFLPVLCVIKAATDDILMSHGLRRRSGTLLSLDPNSEEVSGKSCAIVMSCAVSGVEGADALYDRLLKLYASNPQKNISIVALCDLPAEQVALTSEDSSVAQSIGDVISRLNTELGGSFQAVIRKRSYSKTQDEYMGKERKRGAILELCKYMATGESDFFAAIGDCGKLVGCEYICAVDFDTEPYIDSVNELLAIAMHPANLAVVSQGRVVKGHGMIAPRMVTRLQESLSSGFARGVGGIGSVSSYDSLSHDFWQQVFGRGSFCGKGLINVGALLETSGAFPQECVLSHDILEGELTACAYAGNVIFTEGFPKSAIGYYKRLDRWIRGDVQNIRLLGSSKLDMLAKLKLIDNLRRALTPISVLACMYLTLFLYPGAYGYAAVLALCAYFLPMILGLVRTVFSQGVSTRRFYSGLLSQSTYQLVRLFYELVMLPTLAVKSARAVITAAVRSLTGRKLLEWTTSAAEDSAYSDPLVFFFIPEAAGLGLMCSKSYAVRLFAVFFSLMPVLLVMGSRLKNSFQSRLNYRETRSISSQIADMWRFYADFVTEAENYLPPDNVQFSPVYRICHRTSPTNIGMYMLSCLAACDRRLISVHNMAKRLRLTLDSLERMEKYKGNLYNWYDTETLDLCPNPYVSSVDSGNFICSLVALKEGLGEYTSRCSELEALINRVQRLIDETDLSAFYNNIKGLMSIGIRPATGELDGSCYDCLMSEARLTSYYAIATRQIPKDHWTRLARIYQGNGFFSGCVSYSGTMFEFFMPELFLKSPDGSLLNESLRYALYCQRDYSQSFSRPYGISESGYYSFDSSLSYRYMAHGVPKAGLRRGLDADYVVSPYSTYLSLSYSVSAGMENLERLRKYGMYSRYGFYEALDFTPCDLGKEPQAVKSYMAHHVGMSIIACANLLQDGIFQKRFMRDINVLGASELLSERVMLGRSLLENLKTKPKSVTDAPSPQSAESFDDADLFRPRAKLLSNGEYTLVMTDGGISYAKYRDKNVYLRTRDCVLRPKGAFFGVSDGDESLSFTAFPSAEKGTVCEFGDNYCAYYASTKKLAAGMRVTLCKNLPCELRSIALENLTDEALHTSLYSYIEPSLNDDGAEGAHPAFAKLFLRPDVDPELGVVTVTRIGGKEKIYMAVGFSQDILGAVSFNREEVLCRPHGVAGLFERASAIPQSYISEPDPCVFVRTELDIPPRSKTELNMFILMADSRPELVNRVLELKRRFSRISELLPVSGAGAKLADSLLTPIMFVPDSSSEREKALARNTLPLNSLWELSVSTDLPLLLLRLNSRNDSEKLSAYFSAYRRLALSGIKATLAIVFDDCGNYRREHYTEVLSAAKKQGVDGMLYSDGGIIPIDCSGVRSELVDLLVAYSCHISPDSIVSDRENRTSGTLITLKSVKPQHKKVDQEIALGGFTGDSYVINSKPLLPWCHVLSNSQFGTLVSDMSLGFTYAFNSRENRLTPWDNDACNDNIGERIILHSSDGFFDIVRGSCAVFSPYKAEYFFKEEGMSGSICVCVSAKGMCKRITLDIYCAEDCELAYYCEPCLGVDRARSRLLLPERIQDSLVISSCAGELYGYMSLSASKDCRFITDRSSFWQGCWKENISVGAQTVASCAVRLLKGRNKLDFYLSYALSVNAAVSMPQCFHLQTDTRENVLKTVSLPDNKELTMLLEKGWLRYQTLHARIYARTGFYQCSGAYGFRDQLQDAVNLIPENPSVCKAQILRACKAQFIEGDVLHWWHSLPLKKIRGIRTMISDDNLWLPYAVCEYAERTKDYGILELNVSYCQGIERSDGEKEKYGEVYPTSLRESVYMHCTRAIDSRLGKVGEHGLMLIGTGDWNDGMNSVGDKGRGESVWLSEFFILVLKRFSSLSSDTDSEYSRKLLLAARELENSIGLYGRDKNWYKRAYTDEGAVLGSAESCVIKIDSIAQSFAQFAGLDDSEFTRTALINSYNELADVRRGVIRLFSGAVADDHEPRIGYIQDYPDGIRENGGQYTHAAVWLGMALLDAGLKEQGLNVLSAVNPVIRSLYNGYERYKTEPYYISGDVYSNKNCYSRGGWSIYTGSSGWYYRALTDLTQTGDTQQ